MWIQGGRFFANPERREFPNPILYNREKRLEDMASHSHNPLPSAPEYQAHINEMNAIFDQKRSNARFFRFTSQSN